jgi:MFS family permease
MLGQFASMNMHIVTGSLLLYRLTGSAALLGIMSLVVAVPMLFLSLFGGAIADRVQKKQVLILGLISSAVVSLGVALALSTGYLSRDNAGSWWILIATAFLQGTIMGLMMPARQAIIPEIVSREQVMNAVALNTLGMNVLRLLAPAVAGFLIDAYDFKAVYYAMTGMNIYAAGFILFIPPTSQTTTHGGNILADIQEGLQYILREKTVLLILAYTLVVVVFSMPYQQLLPIFVDDILKVGATGMGVLMSVSGAGAMVGSLILASLPNKRRGVILLASGLVSGLALASFSLSSSWGISLALIVFVGLGQTGRITMSNTLLQTYVEGEYMGRVMSIFNMEWGLVSLGTFAAGLMAETISVRWVVGGFALILTILSMLALFLVPRLRKLN